MTHSGVIDGRALVAGPAAGPALVLTEPLSFWGGLDPATGRVIDRRHPQHGQETTGRVLVMPAGRGSSSSSSVLAEAIRLETSPAAILLAESDTILVIGALVAAELYGRTVPIVQIPPAALERIRNGASLEIRTDGTVAMDPPDGPS